MTNYSSFSTTSRFTAREPEQIADNLRGDFEPAHVSTRPGPGGSKLSYIEGWKVIEKANEIFNFDGWSSQIIKMETDYVDNIDGRWSVGINIVIRVSLVSGTYHEDVGFGSATNERSKGAALEKARKEASTDALKRALRLFGNNLGNCIYSKKYLQSLTKRVIIIYIIKLLY
ncbi:Rad52/22 double-strand break repair protein [Conidiobolus coronatus NRRL 28638]|uniref:Rad52/22 double-strand break repair protein n=1 Tax=Conidiobolus coronatus (strain ATCC 28846 / CBS 209.66 / NRRL 28638) TaxID=796925 RepID=A0A137P4J8_CONC2|nr:Rad52/22 double-strand break repair protein [Conidiobolus coronatus NRRL 28638]|eukprot:KXN69861.1 Rad52/22 double-strand break repair protein [Conidiobolus coronatus NRRL 28638]